MVAVHSRGRKARSAAFFWYTQHIMAVLSLFPELLSYAFVAPLVLRLALSLFLLAEARHLLRKRRERAHAEDAAALPYPPRWGGILEIALALLLLPALFTQAAAFIAALLLGALWRSSALRARFAARHEPLVYLFAAIMALSLVVLGPGAVAIDMPL